jgi:hypothetical protein
MPLLDIAEWIDSVEGRSARQRGATTASLPVCSVQFAQGDSAILVGDWRAGLDVTEVDHTIPGDLYDELFKP